MTTQVESYEIGTQLLGDAFQIEGHLLSTRSADAYHAVERASGNAVILWKLRHPLGLQSDAVKRFVTRMEIIQHLDPAVCQLQRFGIDASGIAFAVFPGLDGHPLQRGSEGYQESQRRFVGCLRLIDHLHQRGIVCGDLCSGSFWLHRDGEVAFTGVMGSFDTEAAATAMMPPMDTLYFVAPEQRAGGGIEPASDVFSLGVLGYYLITGEYPYGKQSMLAGSMLSVEKIKPVSGAIKNAPEWIDSFFQVCLTPHAGERLQNAGAMLQALEEGGQRSAAIAGVPSRRPSEMQPQVQSGSLLKVETTLPIRHTKQEADPAKEARASRRRVLVAGSAAFVVALLCAYAFAGRHAGNEAQKLRDDLAVHLPVADNPNLKTAIDVVRAPQVTLQEKATQMEQWVSSDDPLAHALIVQTAIDADNEDLRSLAEKSLLARARRLGMVRSAEQVKQWLRFRKPNQIPPGYGAVLKSLDKSVPIDVRSGMFREAYPGNERTVLRLAASYALDTDALEDYQPLLAQLVGDTNHLPDAKDHSALALILYDPELALAFGDDAVQRRDKLEDRDVLWVLKALADRNDVNVRAVAALAIDRNLLSPLHRTFMSVVRDRNDLSPDILLALIRAAAGSLHHDDLVTFGAWYDTITEKLLLAICADDTYDKDLIKDGFDILAGKSLRIEPSASLIKWLRREHWNTREQFAHAVGVLGSAEVMSDEQIADALKAFEPYLRDSQVYNLFTDPNHPQIARLLVARYAPSLGLGVLLNLLDYSDKTVRMAAIKALNSYNDVGALKIIVDHFEHERDPEVIQAYKDNFWMIRQRTEKRVVK